MRMGMIDPAPERRPRSSPGQLVGYPRGMPSVVVRRGAAADAALLAEIGARTFAETFGADNRPEDMAVHLAAAFGVRQQTAELLDPDYVTLFAEVDGVAAGFAQVRRHPAPSCVDGAAPIEVHRFYVDRAWHGRGVATALMAACLAVVREMDGRTAWLSVWERNPRAIAFYGKHGFAPVGTTDFWVGPDRQTDHVMARPVA
jgi:GNAT superfamily N-acetyltransferase